MSSEFPLHEKTALVTGASAGIGRETIKALAEDGSNVVLAARREERLNALAATVEEEYDVKALPVPTDISNESEVEELVNETVETFGSLDIVVNNAGTSGEIGGGTEELETERYHTITDVNIDGTFFTTRAALPHLRESSGMLIFVGSFSGNYPSPGFPVYAGTKWWARGFAQSLAGQVGEDDVGVTIVNPSEVRTELGKDFLDEENTLKHQYEPGEVLEPNDVAESIAFAARQESPNVVSELNLYRRDRLGEF